MRCYKGLPVSSGCSESKAKVINSTNDFSKVQQGDIIIVKNSFPGWVIPLIKASGLVCEIGGVASHIAILCRELGKPCVSGIPAIHELIHDDEYIMINGNTGEICIYD